MLREVVIHGRERDKAHGRSVLPAFQREPIRIALVAPFKDDLFIDVRVSSADLYLNSVHNGNVGFYFKGCADGKIIENQKLLSFRNRYEDLGMFASLREISREKIGSTIEALSRWKTDTDIFNKIYPGGGAEPRQSEQAKQLLSLCLVVSESVRFHDVADLVASSLDSGKVSLAGGGGIDLDRLTRSWKKLSFDNSPKVALPAEGTVSAASKGDKG